MKQCCQTRISRRLTSRGLILALFFFMMQTTALAGLLTGKPAPDFQLRDLSGAECSLKGYAGQPVLLKIGTTWCPSCGGQSDELVKALPELQQLRVAVIEVFIEESADTVGAYRAKHRLPEAIRTCLDSDSQVLSGYAVMSIPRVLILDAGHVVVSDQYLLPAERLVEAFRPLAVVGE